MVIRCLLIVSLALANFADASELSVLVDTRAEKIIYGTSFDIQVIAENIPAPIQALRVKPLLRNFSVEYLDKDPGTMQQQSLWLRLSPRRTGKLAIPTLQLLDVMSEPLDIDVLPANINGHEVKLTVNISKNRVWQRQQAIIEVEVSSPQHYYSIEYDQLKIPGFDLLAIPIEKSTLREGNKTAYHTRLGWVLIPLTADDYQISLPGLRYLEGGWKVFEFHTPQLNLNVSRLPSYVGPDIIVGKMQIENQNDSKIFYTNEDLQQLKYIIKSQGIISDWLPRIDDHFIGGHHITFFPSIIQSSLSVNFNGVTALQTISVPYQIHAGSVHRFPSVSIQYFDPDEGKLKKTIVPGFVIFSYSKTYLYLLLVVTAILSIGVFYARQNSLRAFFNRFQKRSQSLRKIRHASSAEDLVTAIRELSQILLLVSNPTLTDFINHWEQRFRADQELDMALQRLNRLRYSNPAQVSASADCHEEIHRLAVTLHQRMKRAGAISCRTIFSPMSAAKRRPSLY